MKFFDFDSGKICCFYWISNKRKIFILFIYIFFSTPHYFFLHSCLPCLRHPYFGFFTFPFFFFHLSANFWVSIALFIIVLFTTDFFFAILGNFEFYFILIFFQERRKCTWRLRPRIKLINSFIVIKFWNFFLLQKSVSRGFGRNLVTHSPSNHVNLINLNVACTCIRRPMRSLGKPKFSTVSVP